MKICREQKINFAQVQLSELNELIALLGEQKDYDTLEVDTPIIESRFHANETRSHCSTNSGTLERPSVPGLLTFFSISVAA